jgi:hypothetical protein
MRKKRWQLITALVLALVVTGGLYASTYLSALVTMGVTATEDEIATSTASASQPDWDSIVTPVVDTETLRPTAAGDETNIASVSGETSHWEAVDEEVADDLSTYVYTSATDYERDLYNIADHSEGGGTISSITVYARCYWSGYAEPNQASIAIAIKSGTGNGAPDTVDEGDEETLATRQAWENFSSEWTVNPATGSAWTWDEIDNLQIGIALRESYSGGPADTCCTQVYVEVDYSYIPISGGVPTGDLFDITPTTDYTGDLAVRVYLTNTGDLVKAYDDLNIRLYLEGSVEAGETPDYLVLTPENGLVTFNLKDYSPGTYTLSVTGGTYTLISDEPSEWEEGWTVTPELYCQILQREIG